MKAGNDVDDGVVIDRIWGEGVIRRMSRKVEILVIMTSVVRVIVKDMVTVILMIDEVEEDVESQLFGIIRQSIRMNCPKVYMDDCFSILYCASNVCELKVVEVMYIRLRKPTYAFKKIMLQHSTSTRSGTFSLLAQKSSIILTTMQFIITPSYMYFTLVLHFICILLLLCVLCFIY